MTRRLTIVLLLCFSAVACSKGDAKAKPKVLAGDPEDDDYDDYEVIGVRADDFKCESVAPLDAVAEALGMEVEPTDPHFKPPAGAPNPCNYASTVPAEPPPGKADDGGPPRAPELRWSFDLDCRESAPRTGEELMVVYASKPDSVPVRVGKSGIDHRDSVLLFIDDNAPCWGRVMGPGAERRLALAKLVTGNLVIENAPREVVRKTSAQGK